MIQRTLWNVRDSDATLILAAGPLRGGCLMTVRAAARLGRPCAVVDPASGNGPRRARMLLRRSRARRLNVAGPRASEAPVAYEAALRFMLDLFQ